MKKKAILFVSIIILIGLILYDNYATKRANDKLKKETYEYKQRLQKCQDERLRNNRGIKYETFNR